jgi:hypothetical protein
VVVVTLIKMQVAVQLLLCLGCISVIFDWLIRVIPSHEPVIRAKHSAISALTCCTCSIHQYWPHGPSTDPCRSNRNRTCMTGTSCGCTLDFSRFSYCILDSAVNFDWVSELFSDETTKFTLVFARIQFAVSESFWHFSCHVPCKYWPKKRL